MQRDAVKEPTSTIGPMEMGLALAKALGLEGVRGIVKMQVTVEAGEVPTLTIVRTLTREQAGAACALLAEWDCELKPRGPHREREIRADGSVVEATAPRFPNLHPREG